MPFYIRLHFLFYVLICLWKGAVIMTVCEIHIQWLSGTVRCGFVSLCRFELMWVLVFLLHNKYFESVTFCFWTLLLPFPLITYSAFWFTSLLLLLLLRASKRRRWNNWKGTNLRYRSKYLYWMRNTIILVCDHWYRDSLRLKKIIVLKQLESLNPESVT